MDSQVRILVVDDNRSLVRVTQRLLLREGYQVLTAFDGLEGLQKAREYRPDLIILDVVMPKMDGYEVCQRLREDADTADIPVLMLTVRGDIDDPSLDEEGMGLRVAERSGAFDAGALDFLTKPVTAQELLARIKPLLWLGSL